MPTDIATRALVVTLKAPAGAAKTTAEIEEITGIPYRTINAIYARAIRQGFEPNERPLRLQDAWLQNAPRSGRPTKQTKETKELIFAKVSIDRYGREKSAADLAGELSLVGIDISKATVTSILKAAGYRKTKPTRKPGLTTKMKKERLEWCLAHQNWTLEDWKSVIWSDETSVILLHRRGGYRIWRKPEERVTRSCIRERWKGSSEFMFWGAFSYDKKGPCHCWKPETKNEKKVADEALEPIMKEQWELTSGLRRLALRNKPGRKPVWNFTKENGKLVREGKGGIDWWRYQQTILVPKLLPFAVECMKERTNTVVQEDKAPAHAHHAQQKVYDAWKVQRLLWCPNSPDLNAIEAAWPWMKRYTTKKGALKSKNEAIHKWEAAWEELPQRSKSG
ncbi:hypothetical protein FOMA001_g12984 [Fusarium oxysporum f. sp. matthiolae]|nr:hypothetical protein FOMA001_g12984 [Fusarium oxysporum f. sp. matthiolae]